MVIQECREAGCRYLDRYPRTDGNCARHDAVGPCRFLIKPLPAFPDP
jgi:hypothetical protein